MEDGNNDENNSQQMVLLVLLVLLVLSRYCCPLALLNFNERDISPIRVYYNSNKVFWSSDSAMTVNNIDKEPSH